jgi:hypothetical protein
MFLVNDLVSFKSQPGIYKIIKIGNEIEVHTHSLKEEKTIFTKKVYYLHDIMSRSKSVLYTAFDNEMTLFKSSFFTPKPVTKKIVKIKKKSSLKRDVEIFLNFFKCIN